MAFFESPLLRALISKSVVFCSIYITLLYTLREKRQKILVEIILKKKISLWKGILDLLFFFHELNGRSNQVLKSISLLRIFELWRCQKEKTRIFLKSSWIEQKIFTNVYYQFLLFFFLPKNLEQCRCTNFYLPKAEIPFIKPLPHHVNFYFISSFKW